MNLVGNAIEHINEIVPNAMNPIGHTIDTLEHMQENLETTQ